MQIFFQPVLALDLGPIIQAIIFLVILASGVVKMFRESKEAQQRADRARQQQPPPPAPGDEDMLPRPGERQAGQARKPQQEAIRSEVEEFLRRVGQQNEGERPARPQQQPPQRRKQPPRIEVFDEESGFDVQERPRQSHRKTQPQARSQPISPEKPQPLPPLRPMGQGVDRGESVTQHVAQHLSHQDDFVRRASQLGEDLSQTDERLEARLHEKFDHGLGSLAARREAREAADLVEAGIAGTPTTAENLLEMLSTPAGVQQAIIMNEILNRPADRW
jgi:hypothetical protein